MTVLNAIFVATVSLFYSSTTLSCCFKRKKPTTSQPIRLLPTASTNTTPHTNPDKGDAKHEQKSPESTTESTTKLVSLSDMLISVGVDPLSSGAQQLQSLLGSKPKSLPTFPALRPDIAKLVETLNSSFSRTQAVAYCDHQIEVLQIMRNQLATTNDLEAVLIPNPEDYAKTLMAHPIDYSKE